MTQRRRNQPSSVDRLPPEVQDEIARLRRLNVTIDEILAHLKMMDVEVSRSALGRHVKSLAEIGDDIRRAETMAKFVVDKFGEEADERIGRANMRILQGAVLELLTARREDDDGNPITLSAGEAKELALTLQRLIAAQNQDAERQLKMRADAKAEAAREASARLADAASKGEIDAAAVERAKQIMGFA